MVLTFFLPILSACTSTPSPNFALFIGNDTDKVIQINGPAANGMAYGPWWNNCLTLQPGDGVTVNLGGPFRWNNDPPSGTALYAFSTDGKCGSNTNVIAFLLGNYQKNGPDPRPGGNPDGCFQGDWDPVHSRWFNTRFVNTCLSWREAFPDKYWLGVYNVTIPGSVLPGIKLVIKPRERS
jgi:hypothetical protein